MPPTGAGTGAGAAATNKDKKSRVGILTKNADTLAEIREMIKKKDSWEVDNNQIIERALNHFLKHLKDLEPRS